MKFTPTANVFAKAEKEKRQEELDNQLQEYVEQFEEWQDNTEEARLASEICRDYKDNQQWTDDEIAELRSRGQAAVTVNRIKPKVEGLKGLLLQRRTDPKAFPRTPRDEKAAEYVTDGLRYIADNTDFDTTKLEVADNIFVEGYGAVIIENKARPDGENEVVINPIPWDRYYFDIHSRRLDFADKRFDGIGLWMDIEDVQADFDLTDDEAEMLLASQEDSDGSETMDDRPNWVDTKNRRVRVCQHFCKHKGVWHLSYFTKNGFLVEPMESPYNDEFGEPMNPIEAQTAYINRRNERFGEVSYWLDLQREINHRRSKFLFLLSSRQTAAPRGAIADVPAMKRELTKPNGHIEYDGAKGEFDILKTNDMGEAQFLLLEDAKKELDAVGFNAQLSGERQGDLSGKAINSLQIAAINELASTYENIAKWEQRVYRQAFARMKQFWQSEKWVRVTDDATKLRWVGFNVPITVQEMLEDQINDDSVPRQQQMEAAALYQQLMAQQSPKLQELHQIQNAIPELDMDINIELSQDVVNIQREQFELLANIAQTRNDVPFTTLLKLSDLRDKDKIIKEMDQAAQAASEQAMEDRAIMIAEKKSKAQKDDADAFKKVAEANQTVEQTKMMKENPPDNTGVVI